MATGRTISWSSLTEQDNNILLACQKISAILAEFSDKEFEEKYGKIHFSRDSGLGRGGGKLQRDALCTRGRQGKAPYSNRNFRWHPLVVADAPISYAEPVEEIKIEGDTLIFFVLEGGIRKEYSADEVWKLPQRYVVLPDHWAPHVEELSQWNDVHWTQNSCVIAAQESCDWSDAVASYATLGISAAISFCGAKFDQVYSGIKNVLDDCGIASSEVLPDDVNAYGYCPVCKKGINETLDNFRKEKRGSTWQPQWRRSKQSEGDDSSVQILHINPLKEVEIRHKPDNVRFGHRWCNVAMSDHSLEETLDFMSHIVAVQKQKNRRNV